MKTLKNRGGFGPMVLGISLMAALYSWIVYAGEVKNEIETDIAAIADAVAAQNPPITVGGVTIPGVVVDPANLLLEKTVQNAVESFQNDSVSAELFDPVVPPADVMVLNHFNKYCKEPPESGTNGSCPSDPLLQYGDMKVSSVLSGTAYDTLRADAAKDFLTSLLDSSQKSAVTNFNNNGTPVSAIIATDPKMKANFAQAIADEAILSVIRQPFAEMIAKRTIPTGDGSGGQSVMQKMEQNAVQRFMSVAWANGLAQKTPQQLQQEQLMMQAFQIWLEYERYRQTERVEALLATSLLQSFKGQKAAAAVAGKADASANAGSSPSSSSSSSGSGS